MTFLQLKAVAYTGDTNVQKFLSYVDSACTAYSITSPVRQLCFLAQVSHESGGFFYTEELASGAAYEGRADLGNTIPGDGVRFKGRGLIQITGRNNYREISMALDVDFIHNPALLGGKNVNESTPDQLKYAALSAGWFWSTRNINELADKISIEQPIDEDTNLEYYKEITKRINGGLNGLPDRLNKYKAGWHEFATPVNLNLNS